MERLVEEYLGKEKKLYAAFMDLVKAYDRVDREALWSVLCICGVGGQLLKRIQAFYRGANACVRVGGEFSESFARGRGSWSGSEVSTLGRWRRVNVNFLCCLRRTRASRGWYYSSAIANPHHSLGPIPITPLAHPHPSLAPSSFSLAHPPTAMLTLTSHPHPRSIPPQHP